MLSWSADVCGRRKFLEVNGSAFWSSQFKNHFRLTWVLIAFSFRGSRWIRLSCFTWAHSSPPNPRSRSLFRGREFRHSEGYQDSHFLTHTFSDVSQGTSSGVTSSPSTSTPRTFFSLIKASQPSQTFKKVTGNEAHFDLFHHTQQAYARHTSITTAHTWW